MPPFDDLVQTQKPPPNRIGSTLDGDTELRMNEAAIMLAFSMHLFAHHRGLKRVEIHPDGEHAKRFDIRAWLTRHDFGYLEPIGKTDYGGVYGSGSLRISVDPRSGLGDVVARGDGFLIVAECKGGLLNTKHSGQLSKLRRGLCECIGQLMTREPPVETERHVAVVPDTPLTRQLGQSIAPRARRAGIEIALVSGDGGVNWLHES